MERVFGSSEYDLVFLFILIKYCFYTIVIVYKIFSVFNMNTILSNNRIRSKNMKFVNISINYGDYVYI